METILKVDAPLYIDVTCCSCRRTVALSNTSEDEGRRYCQRCMEFRLAINPPPVCERMKPYTYNGFTITHYNLGKEQFIACQEANVLRDVTKEGIEQQIDEFVKFTSEDYYNDEG